MSHKWENILILPDVSIHKAIEVINEEALKLALVVTPDRTLLGTVSDGDIRRAIINGIRLDEPVKNVMNTKPTTVDINMPRKRILALMEEKEINAIPILKDHKVVDLKTLHNLIHQDSYENPVFIMAGGFGTRLRPLTDNCPKPLLKVGDKSLLEILISRFVDSGFKSFYISTHYLPEMIKEKIGTGERWGVSISYIHEEEPLGTGGALGLLPQNIPNLPVIVINGDVLTKIDFEALLKFHNQNNSLATMCVREYEYKIPYGVVECDGFKIKNFKEKPTKIYHVNAGIYVINKSVIDDVEMNVKRDMPSIFEDNIDKNVFVYPFHDYWLDIGQMDEFNKAQNDIKTLGI
ncbi:nucleotidyltransferase family protein [Photobacterium galatheae]|uniref:nucleotidyltransferase family protein n=1 Tax=Photobacterium galatheae TaxID=1654360 RepID=UPI00202CD8EB|nr:nucleotidyltransferase family protein [Photobacterium galatheae]MCM0147571.1 nucleotidyltransferase family protein [Photobacterium galatheae]